MSRAIHVFRSPDRFVAGTVGQPGNRTFYLQAVHDARVVSVVLEKQQVAVLAERIDALLVEVNRRFGTPVPPEPPPGLAEFAVLWVPGHPGGMHKTTGVRDPAAAFPLPSTRDDAQERREANRAIAVSACSRPRLAVEGGHTASARRSAERSIFGLIAANPL